MVVSDAEALQVIEAFDSDFYSGEKNQLILQQPTQTMNIYCLHSIKRIQGTPLSKRVHRLKRKD